MTRNNQTGTGGPAGPEKQQADDNPEVAGISEEIYREAVRERDEYLDALRRLQAEFDNYRKRVLRDSQQLQARYAAQTIEDILPVLDNFERALKAAVEHDEQTLGQGVELVYNQLSDVLARRGLCEIEAHGQPFDPTQHEAVLCRPSTEHDEGTVVEVLERGYQVDDTVVRPAKVIVSEGKPEK
ncbi:MAG: nucleotide exchange factor GrpE [Thermoleophilia bacterium]